MRKFNNTRRIQSNFLQQWVRICYQLAILICQERWYLATVVCFDCMEQWRLAFVGCFGLVYPWSLTDAIEFLECVNLKKKNVSLSLVEVSASCIHLMYNSPFFDLNLPVFVLTRSQCKLPRDCATTRILQTNPRHFYFREFSYFLTNTF